MIEDAEFTKVVEEIRETGGRLLDEFVSMSAAERDRCLPHIEELKRQQEVTLAVVDAVHKEATGDK